MTDPNEPYVKFRSEVPKPGSQNVKKHSRIHAAIDNLDPGEAVAFPLADLPKGGQSVLAQYGRKMFGKDGYATRKNMKREVITLYRIR